MHIQNKGKFFVLCLDSTDCLSGRYFILCDYCRHIVSIEPHMICQQETVAHILMPLFRGPRMSCRWEIIFRHIKARHDLYHSRDLLRLRRVYGFYISVSDICVKHLRHIDITVTQVIHIFRAPGYLLQSVHSLHTLSDNVVFFFHTLTSVYERSISIPFTYFACISRSSAR